MSADVLFVSEDETNYFKLSDIGNAELEEFNISSIGIQNYNNSIQGRSGKIDYGSDYTSRKITIRFINNAVDWLDYPFLRDKVFELLGSKKPLFIYEVRDNQVYQKRYLVRVVGSFTPEVFALVHGLVNVEFETIELPFGESAATTLVPFSTDSLGIDGSAIWSIGQAEIFGTEPQYTFSNPTSIQVYNGGTETVDPDEGMYLVIEYVGASTDLKLYNETNGSEWSYTGSSVDGDSIKVDGIHSTLNLLSIVRNTNLELLTLEPGWNTITVTGATSGTLSFDFRWYFR